ncbi:hypothetical protein SAY87_024426 [Trapa incisa]|uniref:Uncharacterized protein n=1 Tax=Trapa incisa TaxID=236973 RepID=A0AAN7GJV7_9MYRT|nr:hypothetical protein SAY87_024426 [Trapa incisa]
MESPFFLQKSEELCPSERTSTTYGVQGVEWEKDERRGHILSHGWLPHPLTVSRFPPCILRLKLISFSTG